MKHSKNSEPPSTTGEASAEWTRPGLRCEQRAEAFLKKNHYIIEARDVRILGVQVDLLARSPRGVKTLFEVKSARSLDFGVLSEAQKCRLVRVAEWLSAREPCFLRVLVEKADKDGFLEIPIED